MRHSIAAAAFLGINLLLAPVTVAGYVLWVGKLVTRRGTGVSGTAQGPLSTRYFEHALGTRQDEAAARLMMALPGVSRVAVHMVTDPVLLGHRLTGYVPRAFRYPFEGDVPPQYETSARTAFFDSVVQRHLADLDQLVILGAGFDTRAFRLPHDAGPRIFEVDAPKKQAVKRDVLEKAGIDSSRVNFVAADFEKDDWLACLKAAGFDPSRPALFLWAGVTMYLARTAVEATLCKIASTAKRSTVGVDSRPPSRERLAELLRPCGLTLGEQQTLGRETGEQRAWGGFATAIVG